MAGSATANSVSSSTMRTSRQRLLLRELVAEPDAVVEGAKHHVQPPAARPLLDQADAQLLVAVADEAALAPGLLPGFVVAFPFHALEPEAALEFRAVGQDEAQPRVGDDRPARARDPRSPAGRRRRASRSR